MSEKAITAITSLSLKGLTALITGASKGIGLACARRFAAEGCNLCLVSRTRADLEKAQRELEVAHPSITVRIFDVDLGNRGCVQSLLERVGAARIDLLVNNAGAIPAGSLFEVDEATWREAWDLKVFAYINLCRAVYAQMKENNGGVIINICGAAANKPQFDYIAGSTANIALEQLTKALGGQSLRDSIRVVGIHPGPVWTPRLAKFLQNKAPLEGPFKPAEPSEIADLAAFLASPLARNITGTVITSDGGNSSRHSLL